MLYQRVVCDRCGAGIDPDCDRYLLVSRDVKNYEYMETSDGPTYHHYCKRCYGDFLRLLRYFDNAGELPHE